MNNINKKVLLAVLLLAAAKPASAGLISGACGYGNYAVKGAAKGCGFIATKAVHHPILAAVAAAATVGVGYLVYSKYPGKKPAVTDVDNENNTEASTVKVQRKSVFSRFNIISPLLSWVRSHAQLPIDRTPTNSRKF